MHHIATKWIYHELADSCCVWFWNLRHIRLRTTVPVQICRNFAACLVVSSIVAASVQAPLIIWPNTVSLMVTWNQSMHMVGFRP
jgi:hypothetical protein